MTQTVKASAFFGYKCPKCNSTIDIAAQIGESDKLLCPSCETEMIPNENGTPIATNVVCKKCNSAYGMINSDTCPNCGEKFQSQ